MVKVINNNILVKLESQSTILGNGLSVNNEVQNRKDIVTGRVLNTSVDSVKIGWTIYFPMYSASMITTSDGEMYIVHVDDVLAVEE